MSYKKIDLTDGIEIVTDAETIRMDASAVSLAADDAALKAALETKAGKPMPDVHVHKAKDGTIYVATGKEPTTWPDQVKADIRDEYLEDETVLSVSQDGTVTNVPDKPPSYYGK